MAAVAAPLKPMLAHIETSHAKMKEVMKAYPSELSALSARTPMSAHPLSAPSLFASPICPPSAYTDFLKAQTPVTPYMNMARARPSSPLPLPPSSPACSVTSATSAPSHSYPIISITHSGSVTPSGRAPACVAKLPYGCVRSPSLRARAASTSSIAKPAALAGLHKRPMMIKQETDSDSDSELDSDSGLSDDAPNGLDAPSDVPMSAPLRPLSFPSSLLASPSPSLSAPADSPLSAAFSATSACFPFNRAPASPAGPWDRLHSLSAAAAAASAAASGKSQRTVRYRSVGTCTVRTVAFNPPRLNDVPAERSKRRKVEDE